MYMLAFLLYVFMCATYIVPAVNSLTLVLQQTIECATVGRQPAK